MIAPVSRAIVCDFTPYFHHLEAHFAFWEPCELNRGGCDRLPAGEIDWCFPLFQSEVAVHFEVLAEALNRLKVDVVQGGAAWDEVLGCLLIAQAHLEPFIAAQVPGNPRLAALVLASDPVAEELAIVGIALPLNPLEVHELAVVACTI